MAAAVLRQEERHAARAHRRVLAVFLFSTPLVRAAAPEAPPGAASCSGCHPASAAIATPVPPLRGRDAAEIVTAMQEFRSGQRQATVMGRIAKGFDDDETRAI